MSALRLVAFADRSWSVGQDVQEISRFSCMLFLSVRRFLDYAGPDNPLTISVVEALQRPGRIRLVKGAYETPEAIAIRWGQGTDSAFCALMETLLASGHPCLIAIHNENLLQHAHRFIQKHSLPAAPIEFEMNFGICQTRLERLRDLGYGTRAYLPYGKEWYLYLCHRLAEFPTNIFRAIVDIAEGLGANKDLPIMGSPSS